MKLKNLIYICIGAVLLIACVGLIYVNLDNGSNIIDNNSKVNNTSSINTSNINGTENNTNNSAHEIASVRNIKDSNNPERKNEPSNISKKSRLSYSEAVTSATKIAKEAFEGPSTKVYVKYKGQVYDNGKLYWKFNVYSKKNNEFLGRFSIDDLTGEGALL